MKKRILILAFAMFSMTTLVFPQAGFKEYKAGHVFNVSLPEYMSKTIGLNAASTIQFKSEVKDVYGFIILDTKEDLRLAELSFSSINEFYEDFIKDFVKDEKKRKVSKAVSKKVGNISFMEADVSYYDSEVGVEIYYFVGIVETPACYYKVLCWGTLENKDKFKADFQKILYSVKD